MLAYRLAHIWWSGMTHYGNQESVGCVVCGFTARTSQYATIEAYGDGLPQRVEQKVSAWGFASQVVSARIAVCAPA